MKSLFASGVFFFVAIASAVAAPCTTPDVTGLYKGNANTLGGTKVDVALNLFCDGDHATAQLFTSMGDFAVKRTAIEAGGVTVDFDSGASLGTFTVTAQGDRLTGAFAMADDKGTIALTKTGDAIAADAMKPRLDLTPAQWHEDLAYLARELPKRHANAFFRISPKKFESEVLALDRRIDTANGDEIFVGLQAIAKSIGDGHTGLFGLGMDRKVMPVTFAKFGDDIRVVGVGAGYEKMLGGRLVKIGQLPIAEVWAKALTLTPQGELEQLRRADALVYLARGYALHGLDVTQDRNRAIYTVADDRGQTTEYDVQALAPGQDVKMVSAYPDTALRSQFKDQQFWCKSLPDDHALYCDWRAYQDLAKNAKAMFALLDQTKPSKLILDMRDNGGGDNTVGDTKIVKPLVARADINRKGHLYVLIGAETFSAAMNNAAQLQDETKAILVGETIGEKPNSYQEPRQFRLPNSHLIVRASTLYYKFRKKGPNEVAPDKTIIPSWDDAKAARDRVLDWVLMQST